MNIKNNLERKFNLNEMQLEAANLIGKDLVISAPTGCGKTEAILLAITEGQSVNWFLPTITSCIFMYKRLKQDFNDLFTIEVATSVLSEKSYCTRSVNHGHIKIMTPDPVLLDFIKFNIDTGKFNRASEPVLVLDEIDNYPEDVRVVLKKYIDEANLRQVIVASATLDEGLKEAFKEYERIDYNIPNTLKYKVGILGNSRMTVTEGFKELVQKYHKKKRIAVIANSISSFSKYQEALSELNLSERDGVLIHHSNLSDDQRKENEQLLFENNYDILISNDIISFSVDIDTDILVTEISDKLNVNIQRLGRLNRRNRKVDFTNLYICNPDYHWNPRFISDYRASKIFYNYFEHNKMITSNRIEEISKDIIIDISSNDYDDIFEYVKRDILNDVPPKLRDVPATFKIPVQQKRRKKGKKEVEVIKTYSSLKWNTEYNEFPWDENPYSNEKCIEKNIVCIDGQKYIINDLRQLYSGTIILEEYNGETFSPWVEKVEIEKVEFDKEEYLFELLHNRSGYTPRRFTVSVSLNIFKEHKITGKRKDEKLLKGDLHIRTEILLYGLFGKSQILDFSKLIKLSLMRTECDNYGDLNRYYAKYHFEEESVGVLVLRNGLFEDLVNRVYKLAKETFDETTIHKTFVVCKEYLNIKMNDLASYRDVTYREFTYLINKNYLMEKYDELTVINKFLGGTECEGYYFRKHPSFMNDLFDDEMRRYEELRNDFLSFCHKLKDSSMDDICEFVNLGLEKMIIIIEEDASFDNLIIEDTDENITVKFYKDNDNVFNIQLSKPLYFYVKLNKDAKISFEELIRMSIINKNILPQNRNSKESFLLNDKESFSKVVESLDKAMKEEFINIFTIKNFDTLENFIRSKHCLLEYILFNTFNLFSVEESMEFGLYEKGFLKSYSSSDFTENLYEKGYITSKHHLNRDCIIDYLLNGNDIRERINIKELIIDTWYYWHNKKYDLGKNPYYYEYSNKNTEEKESYIKIIDEVKHVVIPLYLDIYKNEELIIKDYKYELEIPAFLGFLCRYESDPINIEPLSAFLKLKRKCKNGLKNTEFVNKFNDILGPMPDVAFFNDFRKLSGIGRDFHKKVIVPEIKKHYSSIYKFLDDEGWASKTIEGRLEICYRNIIYPIKDFLGYHDAMRILESINIFNDLLSEKKDIFINHMKVSLGMPRFDNYLRRNPLETVDVYYYSGDIVYGICQTFDDNDDNVKNYLPGDQDLSDEWDDWFYHEDDDWYEDDDDDWYDEEDEDEEVYDEDDDDEYVEEFPNRDKEEIEQKREEKEKDYNVEVVDYYDKDDWESYLIPKHHRMKSSEYKNNDYKSYGPHGNKISFEKDSVDVETLLNEEYPYHQLLTSSSAGFPVSGPSNMEHSIPEDKKDRMIQIIKEISNEILRYAKKEGFGTVYRGLSADVEGKRILESYCKYKKINPSTLLQESGYLFWKGLDYRLNKDGSLFIIKREGVNKNRYIDFNYRWLALHPVYKKYYIDAIRPELERIYGKDFDENKIDYRTFKRDEDEYPIIDKISYKDRHFYLPEDVHQKYFESISIPEGTILS